MKKLVSLFVAFFSFVWLTGAGWLPLTKAPSGGCAEATAFLARNGNANATITSNLICGMVTDTDWAKFDALWIMATDTQAHALLNAVSSSFALTATNSPTFTANTGFTGVATAFLNTNYNPTTASGLYVQNSGSIGYCNLTNSTAADNSVPIGINNNSWVIQGQSAGSDVFDVNDGNFPTVAIANHQGFYAASRTASNTIRFYAGGSSSFVGSDGGASSAVANVNFFILGANNSGSLVHPTTDTIALAFIANGIDGAAYARIAARVNTYTAALGLSGC